jgi:NADH-quinone oxidoreductase subunit F
MASYIDLRFAAEPARRRIAATEKARVAVAIDTSSIATGALKTLDAIRNAVSARGLDVVVDRVGGNGLNFANPTVEVAWPDGARVLYQRVEPSQAVEFVEAVLVNNQRDNGWLLGALDGAPNLTQMSDHGWWSIQPRRMMQDMGVIDPENIDEALVNGAYSGLHRALAMSQEEVIAEVSGSKLSGRSGGFFPTGRKWDFLRGSKTTPKAMVCNADEGDPGAWVNRLTLENDPHALIEGMAIGGYATGADRGYVYIREEYPLAFERMELAVQQAREKNLLGEGILGSEFSFDLKVVRGAGSYVCGEESGLIASVEDGRGMPKLRPPFPAESGVFGQGSNVNNVGSYHGAAWVMRNGIEEWVKLGTERNPSTMVFSLSGNVQRVGAFELAFGTPVKDAYEVCAGGAPEGHTFKALQPGGPLLGIIPGFAMELTIEAESFREKGAVGLGGGGLVFLDDTACVLDLCAQFEWFIEDESCGRCTTCHGGSQRATEIIRRIQRGGGRESDVGKLRLLAQTLRYSNCFHGQFALTTLINAVDFFTSEIDEHIYERKCRAQTCFGLVRYEANRDAANGDALVRANQLCINALTGESEGACFNCPVCHELMPEAVRIVDAFEPGVGPAPELISIQPAER